MNCITLTLNPAFDVHCAGESFLAEHENFADILSEEAGGKGINLARALIAGGTPGKALAVLGDEKTDAFLSLLKADSLDLLTLRVPGRIRENITLHVKDHKETRLSFRGFDAPIGLLERVTALLDAELEKGDVLTFTGSATPGLEKGELKVFLTHFREKGVKIVIDSRSFDLSDLLSLRPWLIKPNEEEASSLFGKPVTSFEDVKDAARTLSEKGIENVMVTLGPRGILLASHGTLLSAVPPAITPLSTIGAGDSTIAGFITGHISGETLPSALARAAATGSAACLTPGSRPPKEEDIKKLLPLTKIKTYE